MRKAFMILIPIVLGVTAYNLSPFPVELRFSIPILNTTFAVMAGIFMPVTLLWIAISVKNKLLKALIALTGAVNILAYLILFPLLVPFTIYADDMFTKIDEISLGNHKYRLYRTDCGATCAFGLVLQKEFDLGIGIKTVEVVFSKYRANEGHLSLIENDKIRLEVSPYYAGFSPEFYSFPVK